MFAVFASALACATALSGCGFRGIHSLPLPGGAGTGGDAYTVVIEFSDVTALVPQSAVKRNNVTVGTVTDIELEGWHARVTARIKEDVRLPANASAKVAQTSLLGEKYVQIGQPSAGKPRGQLEDGGVIPLARTGRYPEVEQVLSALSLLLNGGGLAQLQTINNELNAALSGREDAIRDVLSKLDTFVGGLEEQKAEIVRALEGLERLTGTLADQKKTLANAVDRIEPALEILNEQQEDLTKMLVALSDLGEVATRVINESKQDLLANLRNLEPILDRLEASGDDLAEALPLLATFPFPSTTRQGIRGDYVNLSVTADLGVQTLLNNLDLSGSGPPGKGAQESSGSGENGASEGEGSPPGSSSSPGQGPSSESSSSPSPGAGQDGGRESSGGGDSGDGGLLDLLGGGSG